MSENIWKDIIIQNRNNVSIFTRIHNLCKEDEARYYKAVDTAIVRELDREVAYLIPQYNTEQELANYMKIQVSAMFNVSRRIWSDLLSKAWELR